MSELAHDTLNDSFELYEILKSSQPNQENLQKKWCFIIWRDFWNTLLANVCDIWILAKIRAERNKLNTPLNLYRKITAVKKIMNDKQSLLVIDAKLGHSSFHLWLVTSEWLFKTFFFLLNVLKYELYKLWMLLNWKNYF